MDTSLTDIVNDLMPLLPQFCQGAYGTALGGAHAKGVDDAESDLDLYVFTREVLPMEERSRVCAAYSPAISGVTSWGDDAAFVQGGTDFYYQGKKVEVWFRHIDYIESIINECQAGIVKREYVTWTVVGGFFNHCTLSDLAKMQPLDDPDGLLADWKRTVKHYPPQMKQRIVNDYLQYARFWPDNFHYKSAIARCDVIYTSGIVQQVVHNLIQVVFALNEAYFPGDKKLDAYLDRLPLKPEGFTQRVKRLLFPECAPDISVLQGQREELLLLVAEVAALTE